MNKPFKLFLDKFKKLNIPKGEYVIFASGPMGVRGLRDTHDIDVVVTKEIYEKYKNTEGWDTVEFQREGRDVEMIENDGVEFYTDWGPGEWNVRDLISSGEEIDGAYFAPLDQVRKWKLLSAREKDLKDVGLIDKYLMLK